LSGFLITDEKNKDNKLEKECKLQEKKRKTLKTLAECALMTETQTPAHYVVFYAGYRPKWVPLNQNRARPQVANRTGDLQIWRLAATISKNQLGTSDKGWFSSLGFWRWGANNTSLNKCNM